MLYVAVGFLVIAVLLFAFNRLSRVPGATKPPPRGLADEAADWLENQR